MTDTVKMLRPELKGSVQDPSGHVRHDDRGNAIWEWANDCADEPLSRISALEISDANGDSREISVKTGGYVKIAAKGGNNPYESGLVKKTAPAVKRDLRELSRWIEERRQRGEPTKF